MRTRRPLALRLSEACCSANVFLFAAWKLRSECREKTWDRRRSANSCRAAIFVTPSASWVSDEIHFSFVFISSIFCFTTMTSIFDLRSPCICGTSAFRGGLHGNVVDVQMAKFKPTGHACMPEDQKIFKSIHCTSACLCFGVEAAATDSGELVASPIENNVGSVGLIQLSLQGFHTHQQNKVAALGFMFSSNTPGRITQGYMHSSCSWPRSEKGVQHHYWLWQISEVCLLG